MNSTPLHPHRSHGRCQKSLRNLVIMKRGFCATKPTAGLAAASRMRVAGLSNVTGGVTAERAKEPPMRAETRVVL